MKHLALDFHFVREMVQSKSLQVIYLSTLEQAADIFTKGLAASWFEFLKNKLKVLTPLHFEGGSNRYLLSVLLLSVSSC